MFTRSKLRSPQCGLTLIELILFIVIVSLALAGVLLAFNVAVRGSADPMNRKQAIAIADSLMDEIALQPYTYCDPTDANFRYARAANTAAGNCATTVEAIGPETGQTRYSSLTPFNNVNDYHGFKMVGIVRLGNDPTANVNGLAGYTATATVTAEAGGLRIDVNVTGSGENITLTSYRFMTAPNFGG